MRPQKFAPLELIVGGAHGYAMVPESPLYLRLIWKCEVGAQLGLKRLIWGQVVFFKGFHVKSCGFWG